MYMYHVARFLFVLDATTSLANQAVSLSKQPLVGFTASLTSTLTNLGTHQHVIFDNVVSNVGNAYNSRDGHFSAPAVGLYSFFLTATNVPGYSASLSLMLNGLTKAVTLAHGTSNAPGQWETSTCSVVLMLARGEEVWAQNEGAFSTVEQLDGHLYSSFGGFLIQAL